MLVQWWGDDRQVSQNGKPLCTGASLWAVPKLARGLRPLEPRYANDVSIPEKCPLDIPAEHLLNKKIWDDLYKMVWISSVSFVAVLGDLIREYLPLNLILMILLINVGTILIRVYLKKKYPQMYD